MSENAAELRLVEDELALLIYRNSSMSAEAAILLAQEIYKNYWVEKKWSDSPGIPIAPSES